MIKVNAVLKILVALTIAPGLAFAAGTGEVNNNNQVKMPTPRNVQSTNSSAGQGKSSQLLGAGMNAAAGVMFFDMCTPKSWWYCAMGALSFMQAAETMKASHQSGAVQMATDGVVLPDDYNPISGTDSSGTTNLTPAQQAAFNDLKKQGYVATSGGVRLPDGRMVKASDFSSAEAMAAAGVPSGSIGGALSGIASVSSEAMKNADAIAGSEANVVSMGVDSSSGGGGGRGPASEGDDSSLDDYLNKLRNPFGMDANKKQKALEGKTLTHGDDQIGVKVDDIFRMVHLRYQKKRASEEFIEPATAATAVPGAASGAGKNSLISPKRSR